MTRAKFDNLVKQFQAAQGLSPADLAALEPYRAKRAIFLAAGFGSRLAPVTLTTPKPLVRVNGVRIIDTAIDACLAAGIREIYIVRGYLAEQFDVLLEKYPMIQFLENPSYNSANNISSAYLARDLLENAYVLEADLLISNPAIIRPYHYQSDVLGIKVEHSDDWCLFADANGNVCEERLGGDHCYQMVGIYYFNAPDARELSTDLFRTYHYIPDGKTQYWETVPNQIHRGKYAIEILPCHQSDVIEIDTLAELQAIDKSYIT
ncbi:phosphocholine cytidylyltransferase family protein [Candidatus Saccharibacteria bacterium]|nr:phosphocholine cytidylyltransferase family protein [Candidatus Saccharibacteria bacterium]